MTHVPRVDQWRYGCGLHCITAGTLSHTMREDVWAYIALFLSTFYRRIHPATQITDVGILSPSPPRQSKPLPPECLDLIFSFYAASVVDGLNYGTVRDYRTRQRYFMQELCKVARCSRLFNEVMIGSLRRIWVSSGHCPVSCVMSSGVYDPPSPGVWIITAETELLPLDFSLAAYKTLEVASINYHRGVEWNTSQQVFVRSLCITKYPSSLRQLEILRLHTPEEEVIRLVSDCCPGLTELRIVRCTMFNCPGCWYWRTHTTNQDHDYMQSSDPVAVVAYANRMASLLRGLQQLEAIHMGHYLINIQAVFRHRLDDMHRRYHPIVDEQSYFDGVTRFSPVHYRASVNDDGGPPIGLNTVPLAKQELWKEPCPECHREFARPIEQAERLAARILASHFCALKHVSFAGFLSDRRIRPSAWLVGRQRRGEDLYVWTEGPTRPRSRLIERMVRVGERWHPVPVIQ